MRITHNLKYKLGNTSFAELEELARQHNNENVLQTLRVEEDFERVSEMLGLQVNFEEYQTQCKTAAGKLHLQFRALRTDYYYFLLAHICLPNEIQPDNEE